MDTVQAPSSVSAPSKTALVKKHSLVTRLWHWTNAVALLVMLMSGLMIFNAHPRLYWGHYGAQDDAAWLEIGNKGDEGFLRVGDLRIETTGLLGSSSNSEGKPEAAICLFAFYCTQLAFCLCLGAGPWP
jgi:Prokaryotic cytochrome b561